MRLQTRALLDLAFQAMSGRLPQTHGKGNKNAPPARRRTDKV